jgi:hypothetical protein
LRDPGYNASPVRRFEFVPLLSIAVFFPHRMRRVACPGYGIKVKKVPWSEEKNNLTGLNNKTKVTSQKAYDFKRFDIIKNAYIEHLGICTRQKLPVDFADETKFYLA